jgi:hypothetical protein
MGAVAESSKMLSFRIFSFSLRQDCGASFVRGENRGRREHVWRSNSRIGDDGDGVFWKRTFLKLSEAPLGLFHVDSSDGNPSISMPFSVLDCALYENARRPFAASIACDLEFLAEGASFHPIS